MPTGSFHILAILSDKYQALGLLFDRSLLGRYGLALFLGFICMMFKALFVLLLVLCIVVCMFGLFLFILLDFFLLFVNCIFVFLVFSLVCFRMGPAFLGRIRLFLNFIQILFVIIFLVNFVCFVTFSSHLDLDYYQAMSTQFNSTIFSYFLVLNQILDIKIAVEFYLNHFTKI